MCAEISCGECGTPSISTHASPFFAGTMRYGSVTPARCTDASLALRPISRLTPNTVRDGFVTIWRLLAAPTTTSPSEFHDTIDGVVRPPSWLWITVGSPASSAATHEFVVPRSMPMMRPIAGANRTLLLEQPGQQAPGRTLGRLGVGDLRERRLGGAELGVELQRARELGARFVAAARVLRLAPARVREQRAVALLLRVARGERVQR